ncbi:MAG: GNAT family N-acetyltransferase [Defluviitaleaceae bacterium]|nr:GNAT family N-acetyltransferase [Defluviitaleaceae bacterium]
MLDKIFEIYKQAMPDVMRGEEKVKSILEACRIITVDADDRTVGFSAVHENTIYLLCVEEGFRGRGLGSELLRRSEEYISSRGFDKVRLGAGQEYIVPGVPMGDGVHEFFKKRGYVHWWGDAGCFDMSLDLKNFSENSVGDTIHGITYRWASKKDISDVLACVKDAEESFVQYYTDERFYEAEHDTAVLVAEEAGEIIGAIQVSREVEKKGVGTVGCTATMKKHRGRGIAGGLVMSGTKHLKNAGMSGAFLGYTYTAILNIYGRAGYKICAEYFMGEKFLPDANQG